MAKALECERDPSVSGFRWILQAIRRKLCNNCIPALCSDRWKEEEKEEGQEREANEDAADSLHLVGKLQRSIPMLKTKLTAAPAMGYPDFSLPFILQTDTSGDGLGAVLVQIQDRGERVIPYANCAFHASERNYPAHKLEFMALKWVVTDKFHDYLYGRQFQAYTDNNPLAYVMTSAKLDCHSQRLAAVFLRLLHYLPLASGVSIYATQAKVCMIDK